MAEYLRLYDVVHADQVENAVESGDKTIRFELDENEFEAAIVEKFKQFSHPYSYSLVDVQEDGSYTTIEGSERTSKAVLFRERRMESVFLA